MLISVQIKCRDEIHVAKQVVEDNNKRESDRKTAVLFGELVFHNGSEIEDDGLQDDRLYVDLGDDPLEVLEIEPQKRIEEAHQNGLSIKRTRKRG